MAPSLIRSGTLEKLVGFPRGTSLSKLNVNYCISIVVNIENSANWVNHLQPLYIAGRAFATTSSSHCPPSQQGSRFHDCADEHAAEKIALLKQLARIENDTGWKTSDRSEELRKLWGLA